MKANIDSVQRVEPHKFSSIELNPHYVRNEEKKNNFFYDPIRFRLYGDMQNFPAQSRG